MKTQCRCTWLGMFGCQFSPRTRLQQVREYSVTIHSAPTQFLPIYVQFGLLGCTPRVEVGYNASAVAL
jgi:hypothetical protein